MQPLDTTAAERLRASVRRDYPLVARDVSVGVRVWKVTAVPDQDSLLDAAADFDEFPYGFLLWEAAIALARRVAAGVDLSGKAVLELGAGVGLPGLVARSNGAEVWQTDRTDNSLALARVNAFDNDVGGMNYFVGDWRDWRHESRYDLILGADIMYNREVFFDLESIFRRNLKPCGTVMLSDPARPQAMELAGRLETTGWSVDMQTVSVAGLESSVESVEVGLLTCMPRR